MPNAYFIEVHGVVQGVGFRPFVCRLAREHGLTGWVLNAESGVEIHLEGKEEPLQFFLRKLRTEPPPAAAISAFEIRPVRPFGYSEFTIRGSEDLRQPTVRISPDLPTCEACLRELFDPGDQRFHYPYINCVSCGPRYTVIRHLPYDRSNTTMSDWPLDRYCASEYCEPLNRRFHAQPVACPQCGPRYWFEAGGEVASGDDEVISRAVESLRAGKILAVKGLGGYHLACDAQNADAVFALRTRKYRKEKPFALMVKNIGVARELVDLSLEAETLMNSVARPIVLSRAKVELPGVAPDNDELGLLLPYSPLHHLLFAAGAPRVLVMTSANRSSEPIAYLDENARKDLSGIADVFLIGERPIARRVDDSVARVGAFGPAILRRARGYAPLAVASIPAVRPILGLGADLKSTITLVVDGQAFISQHIGDLEHYEASRAFAETIEDLLSMYRIDRRDLLIVRDAHPQYVSAAYSEKIEECEKCAVQHHRAHIASVLAERGAWDQRVIGASFDGTGYGDDRTIWGGEFFVGSLRSGFARVAHLRPALLPGGDAAAAYPVQAAAGFLFALDSLPDLTLEPFLFPTRYRDAARLVRKGLRVFSTTSVGRLFDVAAALLGFTRKITFEGQAAMWLERLAHHASLRDAYAFPFVDGELDFRPLLSQVIHDRMRGRPPSEIARAFQRGVASGLAKALGDMCVKYETDIAVLSGGVFQNELLLTDLRDLAPAKDFNIWTNHAVPSNDGGISLGQAALAAFSNSSFSCEPLTAVHSATVRPGTATPRRDYA